MACVCFRGTDPQVKLYAGEVERVVMYAALLPIYYNLTWGDRPYDSLRPKSLREHTLVDLTEFPGVQFPPSHAR